MEWLSYKIINGLKSQTKMVEEGVPTRGFSGRTAKTGTAVKIDVSPTLHIVDQDIIIN